MYKLFSDGGSRGNPGDGGIGFIIFDGEKLIDFGAKYIGISTNNQAEYLGLILGIETASKLGIKNLECNLDSELVVKQINGEYKISNADLKNLFDKIVSLKKRFDEIKFQHVPRKENKFADQLVNIVLDGHFA